MTSPVEVVVSGAVEVVEVYQTPDVLEVVVPAAPLVIERAYDKSLGTTKGDPGPPGVPGQPGQQGPMGPAGGTPTTYTQMTPAYLWIWNHSYPYRPDVDVFDNEGVLMFAEVSHPQAGVVQVRFDIPMTGTTVLR